MFSSSFENNLVHSIGCKLFLFDLYIINIPLKLVFLSSVKYTSGISTSASFIPILFIIYNSPLAILLPYPFILSVGLYFLCSLGYLTEDKNTSLRGMFIIYKSNKNNLQPIEWTRLFSKEDENMKKQYEIKSDNEIKSDDKIKRYVIFSLMILNTDKNSDSHCNLLIFDRLLKTIERFEPHGIMTQWDDSFIDSFINNNILSILQDYTYFSPHSYQSLFGPQVMQFFY